MKKHRLELKEHRYGNARGWTCQASGTYTGHGATRWLAIGNWHALHRRFGTLTTPRHPASTTTRQAHDASARPAACPV